MQVTGQHSVTGMTEHSESSCPSVRQFHFTFSPSGGEEGDRKKTFKKHD